MLHVKTPEEVLALIESEFAAVAEPELVSLSAAMGRILAEDIAATEYVPDFDRSTVDGFAVRALEPTRRFSTEISSLPKSDQPLISLGLPFRT